MFLTCEKCQTKWRLDEKHLAFGGRVVRCTSCGNTWFEEQVAVPGLTPEPEDGTQSFTDLLAGEMTEADHASRAVAPLAVGAEMPVMDDRPAGLGPNAFGAAAFLLLLFATVSVVFLFKNTLARHYPAMTSLYMAAGADLRAPGEGVLLSGLSARGRAGRVVLTGKMSNIGDAAVPYPAFRITLRGEDGVFLKDWPVPAEGERLAPGEIIPLELTLEAAPAGGKSVDIRVTGN